MSRFSLGVVALLMSMIGFGFSTAVARGQGKDLDPPEKVRFETADGVKLQGTFYRSGAKAAPAVIMVHAIGESSAKEKWIELAKALQPNFSVLTFDLRGHGLSVDIDPVLYRTYPANIKATKGIAPNKSKLDWKDIDKNSYTLFINDIAAAKSYLERTKNDLGMCNTQNTIVIGVDQGATLAAIWANSEWYRYKIDFPPPLNDIRFDVRPEGACLSALVLLSPSPKLGLRPVSLSKTLDFPSRQHGLPVALVHGDGDPKDKESLKDKELARVVEKALKAPTTGKKSDLRSKYTKAVELKGAGKLRGVDLLTKSLGTAEGLNAYLTAVLADNAQEWSPRDFVRNKYAWKISADPADAIPARVLTVDVGFPRNPLFPFGVPLPEAVEKNLAFDTYELFVGR